jgi:hypothetical protein
VSKASRRQQRLARQPGATGTTGAASTSTTTPPHASTSPTGTPRAGRRERQRVTYQGQQSFLERHRGLILGAVAFVGIALIGTVIFLQASAPAYACSTEWVPTPTATPAADASPQPGYVEDDMGRKHIATGDPVKYTYCPPASGAHFNAAGQGPISPRLYGPNDVTLPQGWIHNLEHGALVLLYRGDGEGATTTGQAALRAFYESFPNSPVCNIEPGTIQGPVIARFDDMATPYAALVWGRVLPLDTFDAEAILQFYRVWGEQTNPEPLCAAPTPTPSAGASAAPSATPAAPAPSASPSPS